MLGKILRFCSYALSGLMVSKGGELMGFLYAMGKKIKGKTQQVSGDYDIRYGHALKGITRKVKGKVNEKVADQELKSRRRY